MKKKFIALILAVIMTATCVGAGVDVLSGDTVTDEAPTVTEVPDAEPVPTATVAEPDSTLYDKLMACETSDEFEAIAEAAGDEQISALTETELAALEAHYADIYVGVIPETVVFTDAGPFMPAVNVSSTARFRMMRAPAAEEPADNGLALSKTATTNADGTYTITMEAYTTGEVITSTKTVPVDIVLVLDQSGSMAYDFNGNSTNTNSARRQYAMKQAVNNFIDKVNEKYSAEADHRMAIVTFGDGASTLLGWTVVNEAGKTTLQGKISGLPDSPAGATNVAAGMKQAETLMGSGYSYTGTNTQRQKVVIVFTDGVPTTGTVFDTTVATNAIASAKNLKDAGATVYTVGIFTGANPKELYGASGFDTNSDGSIGSKWIMDTWGLFPGTDFPEADRPAGNRFLNYLSSNSPDAMSIGLERSESGLGIFHYKITYKIVKNYTIAASNYYLTAKDSASLSKIFQEISENIQSANINLGSETVVKDAVSPYFDLPANASGIKLYTAAAKADGTFENRVAAPNTVKATVNDDTVSVTGFDFNANFVSDKAKSDGTYGKKLIIEFTVTPKDGFLGGNQVPTNDKAAVYDKDGGEVEAAASPVVDVPVAQPALSVSDKVIYEDGSVALSELYSTNEYTGENAWKADYVDITVDTGVYGSTVSPEYCTDYNIKVSYTPKNEGAENGKDVSATSTVHVLKPTVTVNATDVWKYYGEDYNTPEGSTVTGSVTWADEHGHDISGITVIGSEPYGTDDLQYSYDHGKFVVPNTDTTIKVSAKVGGVEKASTNYVVHPKFCTLTVNKSVAKTYSNNDSFIFNVVGKGNVPYNAQVVITGNGSATLTGLPVGNYTVTEDTGWSWRYTCDSSSASTTLSASKDNDSLTITNKLTENNWLGNETFVINKCESKTIEKVSFIQQAIDFLLGR